MDKNKKRIKIIGLVIIGVLLITASLLIFKNNFTILGFWGKEISSSCMEKVATNECLNRGFTHKYVVNYDKENNNLVFRCLIINEKNETIVQQFVVKLNEERLKICEENKDNVNVIQIRAD